MPTIARLIESCAYDSKLSVAGFNLMNLSVLIEANKMTIYNAASEADARAVLERLENIFQTAS